MTGRQTIRHLRNSDVDLMLEWMHDEKINSTFRFDFASMTREKVIEFICNSFTAENIRANRFYKKCGFYFEGQFREHLFLNGQYKDLNWYAISAEQFAQKNEVEFHFNYSF